MSDFYQFALVHGRFLWNRPHNKKKIHGKVLLDNFQSVLSLTEQIQQRFDLALPVMVKHARNCLFNLDNVNTLNVQVATHFSNFDFNDTVVVI